MPIALNIRLEAFRTFANSETSADQAARVLSDGRVERATVTASAWARWTARSADAKTASSNNNQARDALISALKNQFGVTTFEALPVTVKAALRGSRAMTDAGDFKFVDGRSTSGSPLTQRRIATVLAAVEREVARAVETTAQEHVVTPAVLAERSHPDHVKAFADTVISKLVEPKVPEPNKGAEPNEDAHKPCVIRSRYAVIAQNVIPAFIEKHFCHLSDGNSKHSFQALVNTFLRDHLSICGILPEIDLNPRVVTEWRDREVREAFLEAIRQYNTAHPDSAYYV